MVDGGGDGDRVGGGGGDGDVAVDDVDLTAGGEDDDDDTMCATESFFGFEKYYFKNVMSEIQQTSGPREVAS